MIPRVHYIHIQISTPVFPKYVFIVYPALAPTLQVFSTERSEVVRAVKEEIPNGIWDSPLAKTATIKSIAVAVALIILSTQTCRFGVYTPLERVY